MKIRMKVSISGTRDGAEWPEKGGVIDLPDEEAKHLVATNLAELPPPDPEAEQLAEQAAAEEKARAEQEEQTKKDQAAQEETVNDTAAPSEEALPAEENAAAPVTEEQAVPARKTAAPRKAPVKK